MKRPVRDDDGTYHIKGKHYPELFGSRQQVVNGTAYKTTGELTKKDLMMNKWGRIVSAKKHKTAKKEKRLEKAGYFAKKGKFGFVKKTARKSRKAKKGGSEFDKDEGYGKGYDVEPGDMAPVMSKEEEDAYKEQAEKEAAEEEAAKAQEKEIEAWYKNKENRDKILAEIDSLEGQSVNLGDGIKLEIRDGGERATLVIYNEKEEKIVYDAHPPSMGAFRTGAKKAINSYKGGKKKGGGSCGKPRV